MEINKIITRRLNELMNEYNLSFTDIAQNTGMTRQTITKYFDGKSNAPLHFIQKFYSYLKSKDPKKNLNFLYLIDPDYPTKSITTEKDLKIIGFDQKTIDNLFKIVEHKPEDKLEEYLESERKYYELPMLDTNNLYMLNLILSNPNLLNIVNEMNNLRIRVNGMKLNHLDEMYNKIQHITNLVENKKKSNNTDNDFYNEILSNIQILSLDTSLMEREQQLKLQQNETPDYVTFLKWKLENTIKSLVDDIYNKIVDIQ